jgi:hypothetical protein
VPLVQQSAQAPPCSLHHIRAASDRMQHASADRVWLPVVSRWHRHRMRRALNLKTSCPIQIGLCLLFWHVDH